MADWNLPTTANLYTDLITFLKDRDLDSATMLSTLPANPVANMVRWDAVGNKFDIYNGTIWTALSTVYAINVTALNSQPASYYLDAGNMNAGVLPTAQFTEVSHGAIGGGTTHSAVVASGASGFMTGADKTLLDAIEGGATADQTANEILALLLTVDGPTSTLDADLLDGQEGTAYARTNAIATISAVHTHTARPAFNGGVTATTPPFTVDSAFKVSNLNADWLDGIDAASFARSNAAQAISGVHTHSVIPAFNGGLTGTSAPFTVDSTFKVANLNADLLDGLSSANFNQVTTGTSTNLAASGASVIAGLVMTSGVITSHSVRTLTPANIGALASGATALNATEWNGAAKTSSASGPSAGADGDIHFEY